MSALLSSFSRAGSVYDRFAAPQRWAAEALLHFVRSGKPDHWTELGCGTGLLTTLLRERWPHTPITAIDGSPGMLDQARTRNLPGVDWILHDLETALPELPKSWMISSSSLHWLENPKCFYSRLRMAVSSETPLAISIMLDGTLDELREARRRALPEHPLPLALPDFDELIHTLDSCGWKVERSETETQSFGYASAKELLQSLRSTGVNGAPYGRAQRALTRSELARLEQVITDQQTPPILSYRAGRIFAYAF